MEGLKAKVKRERNEEREEGKTDNNVSKKTAEFKLGTPEGLREASSMLTVQRR